MQGDAVVIMMADESDDCRDVVRYWAELNKGVDCVFGSRFMKGGGVIDYPPLKLFINRMANAFLDFFGAVRRAAPDLTKADVRSVINLSRQQGALAAEETAILQAVLTFGDRPARDVMIPRSRVVSIPARSTFAEIEAICRENRYSRYPVWRENPDDVVGILHVKDLFDVTDEEELTFDLAKRLRPAVLVPEMKRSEDLFREMKRRSAMSWKER